MARRVSIIVEDETEEINALTLAKLLAKQSYENLELIEFVDGAVYFVENEYTRGKRQHYEKLLNELRNRDDILMVDIMDSCEVNTLIFKVKN